MFLNSNEGSKCEKPKIRRPNLKKAELFNGQKTYNATNSLGRNIAKNRCG